MRLLAAFDRYPDSVSLTLEPVATDSQKFDLYLTLHLQAQIQSLLTGEIKWGLKGRKSNFPPFSPHSISPHRGNQMGTKGRKIRFSCS
jgi:hypothetical protein